METIGRVGEDARFLWFLTRDVLLQVNSELL